MQEKYNNQNQSAFNGLACQALQPNRPPQVEHQIGNLSENLNVLESALGCLEQKLSPVVMPCPPVEKCSNATDEHLVAMADTLRSFSRRVAGMRIRIDSILERIEI